MIAPEPIDVSQPLLDSPEFSYEQIAILDQALTAGQAADIRAAWNELNARATSDRDLLACGVTAFLLADLDRAVECLAQVPNSSLGTYYRGLALHSLVRYDEAIQAFEEAKSKGYDNIQCDLLIAGCIRLSGDIDQAESKLRELARDAATRAEYSYQMGCIMTDRGDTYGSLEYFERAVDMDPNHSRALFNLAQLN
ncbi:MAG: DNA-directed RNA polymerase subunit alpha, partial [Planctomycetaceae bacterium]|nr:DNA-directed RNA polymerase subunit alpha [Planctomycetaceae bacterium]